ncbi:MAG: FHIPEP family type III secretion protein [Cyanobacteria bacterium NC_groundwater_1444_Ag_S-0.65um_54_12]|nr:FHIPEP family type III secretion protein [Cyanobacteria bacterium NC_groundwater_1444_Ag_S-0.65um_54_12]
MPQRRGLVPDLVLAGIVILVLAILIIPLPTWMIDLLLIINLVVALIIIFVALYIIRPLEFASFPSLLLIMALYRLAMSIATSRSILANAEAGKVIDTFAHFVVGGNYVVGIILFLILVIVNFIVITEGAKRVAEVAARFTLDAMPGKQMSIDADLAAGLIDADAARKRRENLEREANFFGAMDGANKFVRGDAIASIILIVVNIVGGILIGIFQKGFEIPQALTVFTLLTIGDGLVGLIPSLLISISAGFVTTRAASDFNLATDLKNQLFTSPKVLAISGSVIIAVGFIPGFPVALMLIIGLALLFLAFMAFRRALSPAGGGAAPTEPGAAGEEYDEYSPESDEDLKNPENVMKMLGVPPLTLELGLDLVPLVDPGLGGELMDRVVPMRVAIALDMGFVMPGIQFKDNLNLRPNAYQILVKGNVVASGELLVGYMLAIQQATTDTSQELVGFPTADPAFNRNAVWVAGAEAQRAAQLGYLIQDPTNVLTAHLEEVVRSHAHEILSREEVKLMLNRLQEKAPITVKELVPEILSLGEVQRTLQSLLRERVSIRDLATILEKLSDFGKLTKDAFVLTELIRQQLSRNICTQLANAEGVIEVITLEAGVESAITQAIQQGPQGPTLALNPQIAQLVLARLATVYHEATARGQNPAVLTSPPIRPHVKNLVERNFPALAVISYAEISVKFKVQQVGQVSIAIGAVS